MKKSVQTDSTQLAVMANNLENIKEDVAEIKHRLDGNYVTYQEFEPIKKLVYGLVTLILVGVVGGLLSLILKQ